MKSFLNADVSAPHYVSQQSVKNRDVLNEIVRHKMDEVKAIHKATDSERLAKSLSPSRRSLKDALDAPGSSFIFEFKKASPSRGTISKSASIEEYASLYNAKGSAISVLTDNRYFGGSLEDLRQMAQLSDKPFLAKDFFINSVQILRAREAGADAILLMLSVLDDDSFLHLSDVAKRFNMDVLTEVHDARELKRAIDLKAQIIGINNRNLKDLSVALETTEQLAALIPSDRTVISESGISSRGDVLKLAPMVDGFLVGSAVMSATNPEQKINELLFGTVKVCGLTSEAHASFAASNGATYGGLIFVPESPRYVELDRARNISRSADIEFVGIFKNETIEEVCKKAELLNLSAVQLHGDENIVYRQKLRAALPLSIEIWQAVRIKKTLPGEFPLFADRMLLDSFVEDQAGGTGRSFDWSMLSGKPNLSKVILAGGLKLENAANATRIGAGVLDVNSGIEISAGVKCPQKTKAFFEALRFSHTKNRALSDNKGAA